MVLQYYEPVLCMSERSSILQMRYSGHSGHLMLPVLAHMNFLCISIEQLHWAAPGSLVKELPCLSHSSKP